MLQTSFLLDAKSSVWFEKAIAVVKEKKNPFHYHLIKRVTSGFHWLAPIIAIILNMLHAAYKHCFV